MNKHKLEICEDLRAGCMSDLTFSLEALARSANVQPVQIRQWMKAYHQLKHRSITQQCNKRTLHHGHPSSFPQVENLLTWLRDMRETGMAVSVNITVIRASQIDSVFRHKSSSAKYSTIRCLLQSNGIVIRSKTHEAQTVPEEKREEAKAWVATVVPILTQPNHHQDWIANVDQTPVPFTMTPKTTLNGQGSRTVNVHSSTGITMQLTLAVFVTASGKKTHAFHHFQRQTQWTHYEGVFKGQLQIPRECPLHCAGQCMDG